MNINPNLLTGTRYFSGDKWIPHTPGTGLDLNIVPGFAVYSANEDWGGISQYIYVKAGEVYTFSCYFRFLGVSDDYVPHNSSIFIQLNNMGKDQEFSGSFGATVNNYSNPIAYVNNKFVRVHATFKVLTDGWIKPRVERGQSEGITIQEYGLKLERGSEMTPYCGTVEEGGGNLILNDELTSLADNIRSRTGYKEKMTVPEMKDHVKDLSWVNHNLLSGTSDQYQTLYVDSGWFAKTTANSPYYTYRDEKVGDWFTYSATISNYSSHPICLEVWNCKGTTGIQGASDGGYPVNCHSVVVNPGDYNKDVTVYIQRSGTADTLRCYLVASDGKAVNGEQVQVKNERLYRGIQPGVWTPNSVDSTTSNDTFTASTLDQSSSVFSAHDLTIARGTNSSYLGGNPVNYGSTYASRISLSSTKDWMLQVYPTNNILKNIPAGEKVKQEIIIMTDATQIKKAGFDFYYNGQSHVYQATVEQIATNTYRLTACWEAEENVNLYLYSLYHLDLKNASFLDVGICHSWIYTGQSVGWVLSPVMNLLYDTDNMTDNSVWTNIGDVKQSQIKIQGSNNKIGTYNFSTTYTGRAQPIYLQSGVDYTISAYVQTDNDAKVALLLDNTTSYIPDPVGGSLERAVINYDYTTDPYFDLKGDRGYNSRRIGYHFNVSKDGYVAPRVVLNSLNNGSTGTTIRFGGLQLSTNHDVPPYYTSQAGEKLCDMTGINMLHDTQTLKDWTLQNSPAVNVLNEGKYSVAKLSQSWNEIYQDIDMLLRGTRYTYSYNVFSPTLLNAYIRTSSDGSDMQNVVTSVKNGYISPDNTTAFQRYGDSFGRNTIIDTYGSGDNFQMTYGVSDTSWNDNSAYVKLPETPKVYEILPKDNYYAILRQGITYTQTIWIETDAMVNVDTPFNFSWFDMVNGHDKQSAKIISLGNNQYKLVSTYTLGTRKSYKIRLFDITDYNNTLKIYNSGTYLRFTRLKLQYGDRSTDDTPFDNSKRENFVMKNANSIGTNSVRHFLTQSDNSNTSIVSYFYLPKLEIGHKPTSWTEGGDSDVTF